MENLIEFSMPSPAIQTEYFFPLSAVKDGLYEACVEFANSKHGNGK